MKYKITPDKELAKTYKTHGKAECACIFMEFETGVEWFTAATSLLPVTEFYPYCYIGGKTFYIQQYT